MHLLRSILALATLATALLNLPLRDIIDHDDLPRFDAFKSEAENNGFELRPSYKNGVIFINVYNRRNVLQYSQMFFVNENAKNAGRYFFQAPSGLTGDSQRAPKGGKGGKARNRGKRRS